MRLSAAALQTRGLSSLEMGFSGSHYLAAHGRPKMTRLLRSLSAFQPASQFRG